MTFNGSWGWMPYAPAEDWHSTRKVIQMLNQVTAGGGNLLLNIGPEPDGSVPPEATKRLTPVGLWLARNGEAVYGKVHRLDGLRGMPTGWWSRRGNTGYFWCSRWPGSELAIGGLKTKVKRVSLVPTGRRVRFTQEPRRLTLKGLPRKNPDRIAGVSLIRIDFAGKPVQRGWLDCFV
jgi:alpha-L-fucosidase